MQKAICSEDRVTYTAAEFSRLHPQESDRKRRLLFCPECGGPAFFRNVSRNGRIPCFGGRPHRNSCGYAAQDYIRPVDPDDVTHFAQSNLANRIVLDFNFGVQARSDGAEVFEQAQIPNEVGSTRGNSERPSLRRYCRLSSILRTLIATPYFGQSDRVIEIPGRYETSARDFFVPLLNTTNNTAGLFRGYWGFLSDARYAPDQSLWFNSGGRDNISFCLGAQHVEEFCRRFAVDDLEEISGAYILVLGTPQVARNGKLFCLIVDLAYMALRLT